MPSRAHTSCSLLVTEVSGPVFDWCAAGARLRRRSFTGVWRDSLQTSCSEWSQSQQTPLWARLAPHPSLSPQSEDGMDAHVGSAASCKRVLDCGNLHHVSPYWSVWLIWTVSTERTQSLLQWRYSMFHSKALANVCSIFSFLFCCWPSYVIMSMQTFKAVCPLADKHLITVHLVNNTEQTVLLSPWTWTQNS